MEKYYEKNSSDSNITNIAKNIFIIPTKNMHTKITTGLEFADTAKTSSDFEKKV